MRFGVILITWVNHHATLRLADKTSAAFIYANGFLLLAVIAIPFPTSLMGQFLRTDHAAPAVVLYNAILAVVAVSWILIAGAAVRGHLTRDDASTATMAENGRNGYFAFALYAVLAVVAIWLPVTAAIVTTLSWLFWLVLGIRLNRV